MTVTAQQRVAAGVLLAGSLTLGAAAARIDSAALLVRTIVLLSVGYSAIAVVHARQVGTRGGSARPAALPPDPAATPQLTVSVLIPARDEAKVLSALIADLAAQDHLDAAGAPCYEIIVIDDCSSDGTGLVAQHAIDRCGLGGIARVVRRASDPGGKAAALASVPLDALRGDVVAVFDADARLARDVLRRAAGHVARGLDAVTARRRVVSGTDPRGAAGWWARLQDDEQTLDGTLQAARWSLGGCTEFRGDGMFVRRDRLVAAGGWAPDALTEDLELSTRLAARLGLRVAWARDVVVWEEAVPTRSLWRQRLRWAEGTVRRQLELAVGVWRSDRLAPSAKIDYAMYALLSVVAPSMMGLLAGSQQARSWRTIGLVGGAYVASGLVVGVTALGLDTDGDGRPPPLLSRIGRSLCVTAFAAQWLVLLPVAWLRVTIQTAPSTFAPTPHIGLPLAWCPPGEPEA